MKIVNNYSNYDFDLMMENVKNDSIMLEISVRLLELLKNISYDPIANDILDTYGMYDRDVKFKVTLLDLSDKVDANGKRVLDAISFTQSNKAIQLVAKDLNIEIKRDEPLSYNDYTKITRRFLSDKKYLFSPGRSETTIGRIVKKLFDDKYSSAKIEEFVNRFKSINDKNENYELVKGDEIVKWYNEINYTHDGGSLNDSCMRYQRCKEYIEFYAINEDKVSLLILKDPLNEELIIGRAIVWDVDFVDGDKVENKKFMDRIYYTKDYIIEGFIGYAVKKGWLYKKNQNMEEDSPIIDIVNDIIYSSVLIDNVKNHEYYPYMDTMKYFNGSQLTNDLSELDNKDNAIKLVDTYGESESVGYYSDYYGIYIDVESDYSDYDRCDWIDDYRQNDDCYYSDYYEITIANDYTEFNMHDCEGYTLNNDRMDIYRLKEDCYFSDFYDSWVEFDYRDSKMTECIYFSESDDRWRKSGDYEIVDNDETSTTDYAEEHFNFSKNLGMWLTDGVYSEYYNDYLNKDDSVQVILKEGGLDWRKKDDDTYEYNKINDNYYEI